MIQCHKRTSSVDILDFVHRVDYMTFTGLTHVPKQSTATKLDWQMLKRITQQACNYDYQKTPLDASLHYRSDYSTCLLLLQLRVQKTRGIAAQPPLQLHLVPR